MEWEDNPNPKLWFCIFLILFLGSLAGFIYYIYWAVEIAPSKPVNAIIEEIISGKIIAQGLECIEPSESAAGNVQRKRERTLSEEELYGSSGGCKKWRDRVRYEIQLKAKVDGFAEPQSVTHTFSKNIPKVEDPIEVHVKNGVVLDEKQPLEHYHGFFLALVGGFMLVFLNRSIKWGREI